MSYKKIAELAGVSPATVTRVFKGSSEISAETREHVLSVAREHGLLPPRYIWTNQCERKKRVFILVPEIISVHYSKIVSEMIFLLREGGVSSEVIVTGFNIIEQKALLDEVLDDGLADGVILVDITYVSVKSPVIPVFHYDECEILTTAFCAKERAVKQVSYIYAGIDYLFSLGHTRIGFVGETFTGSRLFTFPNAVNNRDIDIRTEDIYIAKNRFEEAGREAAQYFLQKFRKKPDYILPTAFMCAYDEIAFGLINGFLQAGLHIPEDVSVVGINNIPTSEYNAVPLTTVNTHYFADVSICIQMLLNRITDPSCRIPKCVALSCDIVVRASTGPVPKEPVSGKRFSESCSDIQ